MDEYIEKFICHKNYNIIEESNAENSFASEVRIITLENGEKIVIKKPESKERAINEKKYIKLLKENKKVNVPDLIDQPYDEIIVMKFIYGENLIDEKIDEYDEDYIELLAKNLAKLHMFECDIQNQIKEKENWCNYLKNNIENTYQYFNNNKIIDDNIINSTYDYLNQNIEYLENADIKFIHADYRPGNVIISKKGNEIILYTIDFESMKCGDRAFDLVKILNTIKKQKNKEFFVAAYEEEYNDINKYDLSIRIAYYKVYEAFLAVKWCIERNRQESDYYIESLETLVNIKC